MLGGSPARNAVAGTAAAALPISCDVAAHTNVKWVAELGSRTYAGPVVAGGLVVVGTNNERPRDRGTTGDRGVLMAFAAGDGAFRWQVTHPKLPAGHSQDWPLVGLCSTPAIDGDRLFYLSNHGEMVALDLAGARQWTLDLIHDLGVVPHYMTASSPLVAGETVFAVTGNGPDGTGKVPAPTAPSFVAVERTTGKVRWSNASPGAMLLDGQWSSPAYGTLAGRPQVVFPGGDGWLYGFEPATGKLLWKFDLNRPAAPGGERLHESVLATPVIDQGRIYVGVGHDPQRPPGAGRLWALQPDAAGTVTPLWNLGGEAFGTTLSAVAVTGGILYGADLAGFVYAVDAASGKLLWRYDAQAAVWGSPLVADGKVFLGDEDGDLLVLAAGRELKLLGKMSLGSAIYTTPAAAGTVLYVAARDRLFALSSAAAPPPG
jgi:outer membrane protein assembly factor BamB